MKTRLSALFFVFCLLAASLSGEPAAVFALGEDIILCSTEYEVSNTTNTISKIPPNTGSDIFLYYMKRDNPDCVFNVVRNSDNTEASFMQSITDSYSLKVKNSSGATETFGLELSNVYDAEDDFEMYHTGDFSENSLWKAPSSENDEIVFADGNRVYKNTALMTDTSETVLVTTQKAVNGTAEIKFRIRNATPDDGRIIVSLNSAGKEVVLFYLRDVITAFNSKNTVLEDYQGDWVDVRVVIADAGGGKTLSAYLNNGDTPVSVSGAGSDALDWANFEIRFRGKANDSATQDTVIYLDDFSYKTNFSADNGFKKGNVGIYKENSYVGALTAGENRLSIRLENNMGESETVYAIAAEKKNGRLVKVGFSEAVAACGEKTTVSASLDIENEISAAQNEIEFYVWSKNGLMPLNEVYTAKAAKTTQAIAKGHPRIIADVETFEKIAGYTDAVRVAWRNNVLSYADDIEKNITTQGSYRDDNYYIGLTNASMLTMARRIKSYAEVLGMAYMLTGQQKYADAVVKALYAAGGFDNWNPGHALDFAEMTAAFAIGYDWCYNGLTQTQRDDIAGFVHDKGLGLALKAYDNARHSGNSWYNTNTNWNAVCNGGVMMGAIAFAEFCIRTIKRI